MKPVSRRTAMKNLHMRTLAILLGSLASGAFAAPAGTLLFSQEGVRIIDASGATRPARQGDTLQTGERLLTPANGITQVKLPDGSLVSVRPGTELKIDPPPAGNPSQQLLTLIQGAVRVIGSELMDNKRKPSAITLQTGQATLQLTGADIESAVIRPDGPRPQGGGDPGTYNRLLFGAGTLRSGTVLEPLALRQVSFVSLASLQPITLSSVSPTLFTSSSALAGALVSTGTGGTTAPVGGAPLPATSLATTSFTPTTSTLTSSALSGSLISSVGPSNLQNAFSPISTQGGLSTSIASQPKGVLPGAQPIVTYIPVYFAPPVVYKPKPVICTPSPFFGRPPICR
jgi:hypothetical protein